MKVSPRPNLPVNVERILGDLTYTSASLAMSGLPIAMMMA
jgi:hypothetical protein